MVFSTSYVPVQNRCMFSVHCLPLRHLLLLTVIMSSSLLLIFILLVGVTRDTEACKPDCEKVLFNPARSSPFFADGALNMNFFKNHDIDLNPNYWSPYYISNTGNECDMEYWASPYNPGNYSCYQIITHHFIKEKGLRDENSLSVKQFRDSFNTYFDMVWTPDADDTYLVLTCIHSHSSHCDVMLNISTIENETISPVKLASRFIGQSHIIRRLELSDIILKKDQKYILTIEIRSRDYYDIIRHRKKHYWFSIIKIEQSCAAANPKIPKEDEGSDNFPDYPDVPVYIG